MFARISEAGTMSTSIPSTQYNVWYVLDACIYLLNEWPQMGDVKV